jgi:hypothetical protein
MRALIEFFQPGRNVRGSCFCLEGQPENEIARRLSTQHDHELIALKDQAQKFILAIDLVYNERA